MDRAPPRTAAQSAHRRARLTHGRRTLYARSTYGSHAFSVLFYARLTQVSLWAVRRSTGSRWSVKLVLSALGSLFVQACLQQFGDWRDGTAV